MIDGTPFPEALVMLESRGWTLHRVWPPSRVFVHDDHTLPLLVPAHEKVVPNEYVQKTRKIVEEA